MKKLQTKVAVITGSSRGLGLGIAEYLIEDGAKVVLSSVGFDKEELEAATKKLQGEGKDVISVTCDISKEEEVKNLFEQAVKHYGTVDILVNNAALVPNSPEDEKNRNNYYALKNTPIPRASLGITKDFDTATWMKMWNVNVHGTFFCTKYALKIMEEKKYGRIINIVSLAGTTGMSAFAPHYSATKGAVCAFTRSVAAEVCGNNILVNAIAPGGIITPPMEKYLANATEEQKNSLFQMIGMGRLGTPKDFAGLVSYLACEDCYCVGQVIDANGGIQIS